MTPFSSGPSPRAILQRYRLPRNLSEAHDSLFRLSLSLRILSLYHHFFPEDYDRSTERLFPQDDEAYSPREAQFLTLVHDRLFPIHIDYLLDAETAEERSSAILACPLGRTIWDEALEDLPAVWQLAFFLSGEITGDDFDASSIDLHASCDSPLYRAQHIDWDRFCQEWEQVGTSVHPSFVAVPLAIRMGVHSTENAFLDPTEELPLDNFFWNLEDVQILSEHYQEAQKILEQVEELLTWLRSDPEHLEKMLWHMRACLHLPQQALDRDASDEEEQDEEDFE